MKRHTLYIRSLASVLFLTGSLFFTAACSDDEMFESDNTLATGEGISFGATINSNTWEPDTRSNSERSQNFVLRSEDSEDTLCVKMRTEYGIQNVQTDSRGALVTDKTQVTDYGVTSYFYTSTDAATPSSYFMENERVTNGNTTNTYYWPQTGDLKFIAVAPYKEMKLPDDLNSPTLDYTIDGDVKNHEDLMVATTERMNHQGNGDPVGLSFNHILTAIQFAVGDIPAGTIQSIQIATNKGKTLVTSGTYDINNGQWDTATDANRKAATYTISGATTEAGVATTVVNEKTIVSEKLLIMPQAIAEDQVTLTVNFKDSGADEIRTLTATIPAVNWDMSKTTTYTISITPSYTLEFTEYTETLDAHYIITTIKFKTDVDWTMRFPNETTIGVSAKAYLSKEKSNTQVTEGNKDDEITTNQMAGMWSYVEKCNKSTINGKVSQVGTEEEVTVYMLLRENASTADRTIDVELLKTGEKGGKIQSFKQLGYKAYGNFAMERIEDAESPFGFTLDAGKVTYEYSAGNIFENFWAYVLSSIITAEGSGIGWLGDVINGPNDIEINLTSDVSNIESSDSGINNTANASGVTISADANYLINQGWYTTTDTDIEFEDTQTVFQYCLSKNSYGDFTGTNDDTNGTLSIQWYLPAINEMLAIDAQDVTPGDPYSGNYWSSTAIQNKVDDNYCAYSWTYGAQMGQTTPRSTTLKVRCARATK